MSGIDDLFAKIRSGSASANPASLRARFQTGLATFLSSSSEDRKTSVYRARKFVLSQDLQPGQMGTDWHTTYSWSYADDGSMAIDISTVS